MTSTFGALFGADFGVNGPQSGFESRMSTLIVPLKSGGSVGSAPGAPVIIEIAARAKPRPDVLSGRVFIDLPFRQTFPVTSVLVSLLDADTHHRPVGVSVLSSRFMISAAFRLV